MESDDVEAAYQEWLASYRDDELGGSVAKHFLTTGHLRDAFMAGIAAASPAGSRDCPVCAD